MKNIINYVVKYVDKDNAVHYCTACYNNISGLIDYARDFF